MNHPHYRSVLALAVALSIFSLTWRSHSPTALATSQKLSGRILLEVEGHGEAWYVRPEDQHRYYLGRPADAFALMRSVATGISNRDLSRNSNNAPESVLGKIFINVEDAGRAYYVDPVSRSFLSLGRPADAFAVMRSVGLGVRTSILSAIPIGTVIVPSARAQQPSTSSRAAERPDKPQQPPLQPAAKTLTIISAEPTMTQQTQYDGAVVKRIEVNVIVENPGLSKEGSDWRMNLTLDAQTTDASGAPATFFNENALVTINNTFSYPLTTASFVPSATRPQSPAQEYTTLFTVHDRVSGQTATKTIHYSY